MELNKISPYIRFATHSSFENQWALRERIIFDYELIYIDQGIMSVTIDGVEHLCEEGSVIFLRPNQPHIIKKACVGTLSQPHVHFDMVFQKDSHEVYICFENYPDLSLEKRAFIRDDILKIMDIELPTFINLNDSHFIKEKLFQLIDCWSKREPFYELLCKSYMLEILYFLFEKFNKNIKQSENSNLSDSMLLANIKNYISNNYGQNISLTALSKQFGISKFYLTRRFKEIYGKSAIEYLNSVRLERSKLFLKNNNLNISEVSELLGFSSVYVFSRFFKDHMGISPTEFRKQS